MGKEAEINSNNDRISQEERIEDNKKQLYLWLFVAILFLFSSISLAIFAYKIYTDPNQSFFDKDSNQSSNDIASNNDSIPNESLESRLIDGVLVNKETVDLFPLAIVIDNHPDSRPPYGLAHANLVIEAEVEGAMTRYLAFFSSDMDIEQIGPVRSARPYFIDWVREYSALYTHVGGSPEALVKLKKENVFHINEFYNEHKFWRSQSYSPPHNVFTSTELLNKFISENNKTHSAYFSWQYKDDLPLESRPINLDISVGYLIGDVNWQYDKENNNFIRFLSDAPHKDGSGNIITAKNVIIQTIEAEEIDELLRLRMDVVGEGEAVICLDGTCTEGKWKKKNASARTRYYVENDNEIKLNRGTTWVEVVRPEREIIY